MTEKTYPPSSHPGNSCRPRPNPAESAYLRQASSTLTSNPRVVSPYEPGIIRLSHSLPIRHGPIRNCGPITGKPDVMPPGWQITPDKNALLGTLFPGSRPTGNNGTNRACWDYFRLVRNPGTIPGALLIGCEGLTT